MMMGGSSQSTSSLVSNLELSPIFTFGTNNDATIDKVNEQTASTSPRQDASATASVGVGVGGDGSGGAVQRIQDESGAVSSFPSLSNADKQKLLYVGLAAAGVGGIYLLANRKKKKK